MRARRPSLFLFLLVQLCETPKERKRLPKDGDTPSLVSIQLFVGLQLYLFTLLSSSLRQWPALTPSHVLHNGAGDDDSRSTDYLASSPAGTVPAGLGLPAHRAYKAENHARTGHCLIASLSLLSLFAVSLIGAGLRSAPSLVPATNQASPASDTR